MDITERDRTLLGGHPAERLAGRWSAMFVAAISAAYAVVMVVGFASMGNLTDPLPDPYLAVAEVLILVMAPVMVVLMAAVHACAPVHLRMFGLVAFGWMLVAACLTMTVHVVQLVMVRRIEPESVPGFARLFDFAWPSMLYAVDVVAWDLLLGLSLVFAAAVFTGPGYRTARLWLLVSGVLCLVGLVGPAIDVMALRGIGILGYVVAFPIACVALSRAFAAAPAHDVVPAGRS
ncbi:hypothetical protein [Pseudonocardia sp.]|jgi:hypothetical protein|uniref:hypothetical protein n=1 Tax=Pseudonocardia sp. TaxID=60912 RepID=UPI00263370CF|nr:hypothetical protein [Pseudonocardia sp.]MCW2721307.1 hypothetical protein [Pseudonocardia sp.]